MQAEIASQQLEQGIEVLFGGGAQLFSDQRPGRAAR